MSSGCTKYCACLYTNVFASGLIDRQGAGNKRGRSSSRLDLDDDDEIELLISSEIDRLQNELASIRKRPSTSATTAAHNNNNGHHHHHHGPSSNEGDIFEYKTKSSVSIAHERVYWLAIFLLSLSFTALIMNGFEHTLSGQIELAYFVPLLAGHGGNTGGQAVGTVLSALSAGAITRKDVFGVIAKESASGFIVGCILGVFVGPVCHYAMGISRLVSLVVSMTLPLLSAIAAFLGSALPFACVVVGLDPAVIAAPAMTSVVDVAGLIVYFLIANRIFQFFGVEL